MEKIWLNRYQDGIPAEIDPDSYPSLVALFESTCLTYRHRPAFYNFGKTLTFSDINKKSRDFAAYLQQTLGLRKGQRIGLMMPNILQYPIALFGALRAGLVVVNINPLYTADELAYQLNDANVDTIVVLDHFAATVQKVITRSPLKNIIVTRIGDCLGFPKRSIVNFVVKYIKKMVPQWHIANTIAFQNAMTLGSKLKLQNMVLNGDDIAFLQYTGGTTGVAKGAILTHRNMVANVEQTTSWIKPIVTPGKDIIITALPLYHIFSLEANCLTYFKVGALNVLITNPRDIKNFVKEIGKFKFTALTGVNTLFNALLNYKPFRELDFSAFTLALGGGMAVQKSVAKQWKEVAGSVLLQAYGLTETAPAVTINPTNETEYTGSIGLPLPSTEVSIQDATGQILAPGEVGELCVRGPQVMRGYWQNEAETALVLSPDGWLKTGDIARIDEKGYVFIVDRKKDMILISGFNVYPNEVEEVIVSHPEVLEAGVVGEVKPDGNEVVKAYVVKKEQHLTQDVLIAHCREHLTAYKIPKIVEFIDELPKTNVGKVLRRELKQQAMTA